MKKETTATPGRTRRRPAKTTIAASAGIGFIGPGAARSGYSQEELLVPDGVQLLRHGPGAFLDLAHLHGDVRVRSTALVLGDQPLGADHCRTEWPLSSAPSPRRSQCSGNQAGAGRGRFGGADRAGGQSFDDVASKSSPNNSGSSLFANEGQRRDHLLSSLGEGWRRRQGTDGAQRKQELGKNKKKSQPPEA